MFGFNILKMLNFNITFKMYQFDIHYKNNVKYGLVFTEKRYSLYQNVEF